jgi:hypothetical protein
MYRQRYEELAGEMLPAPPSLPLPPAIVAGGQVDLEILLARVDQLIADLDEVGSA